MLKRKIIKLAEKTLVVSLPSSWVESQNIDKGDNVDVSVDDYKLIITPENKNSTTYPIRAAWGIRGRTNRRPCRSDTGFSFNRASGARGGTAWFSWDQKAKQNSRRDQ